MLDAREPASLAERDRAVLADGGPVPVDARMAVYRNNTRAFQRSALERSYPVLRRRVGEEAFGQLSAAYRDMHPSRRGDLHWVGLVFPGWLANRFAGTAYEWLADLARLEWACEEAVAAAARTPLPVESLGSMPADRLERLRLGFQPSLRLVASPWPVWSVWQANQGDAPPRTVDLSQGAEHCAVTCADDRAAVYRLEAGDFDLLRLLVEGQALGEALASLDADATRLQAVLGWAYAEGQVTGFT
jgi:hypothetical protein